MSDFTKLNGYNVKDAIARPMAEANEKNIWKNAMKGFIAHRGFGYNNRYVCQNTELSVAEAFANGFDGVEVDIQYDINNNIVCFHDNTLDATTDQTGYMYEYAYNQVHLKNTVTGLMTTYTPALLTRILRLCALNGKFIYVDFKYINGVHVSYTDVVNLMHEYGIKYYALRINDADFEQVAGIAPEAVLVTNTYSSTGLTLAEAETLAAKAPRVGVYLSINVTESQRAILDSYNIYTVSTAATRCDAILGTSAPRSGCPIAFDSGWLSATVNSPMSTTSDTYQLRYRRINNTVYVTGKVLGFTTDQNVSSNATPIFNLPTSFRPQYNMVFQNAGAHSSQPYIYSTMVMSNGNVRIVRTDAPLSSQTSDGLYINMVFAVAG